MYARCEMKLNSNADLSYQMSSAFHGALMEVIDTDYAEVLHESRLHPYTQHLERRNGEWYWIVTTLDAHATETIITKALLPLHRLELKNHQLTIDIDAKRYEELSERELATAFYQEQASRYIPITFLTPTSFKVNGRYQNYPDIRGIYSNLMRRYDAASETESMCDEDTLEQLTSSTSIVKYNLRSTLFSLEGVRIPAFLGEMTCRISGTQTMCNFANMMFQFGEYSGVGIKTALGMGAIRIREERTATNGRSTD